MRDMVGRQLLALARPGNDCMARRTCIVDLCESSLWAPPASAIVRQQRIRCLWAPASGRIERQMSHLLSLPALKNTGNDAPGRLDFIAASEKRRISQHTIEQEP